MLKTLYLMAFLAMYSVPGHAQVLFDVNFNDDFVGQPPTIGYDGLHPTATDSQGGPIMVVEQLGDLTDQPVLIRDNNDNSSGVYFELRSPVADGILIFQASLVVDRIIEGMGAPTISFIGDGSPNTFIRLSFGQDGNIYVAGLREAVSTCQSMIASHIRIVMDFNNRYYTIYINDIEVATEVAFNTAYGSTSTQFHWLNFSSSAYQTELTGFAFDNIKLTWDRTMSNNPITWMQFKSP